MNSEYVINSIYNPKKKAKESFVFPKIAKPESTPPESKVFGRSSRKYNQQNIFKVDDEKKKLKLKIEEDRFKDIKSRETEELEVKLAELTRRHHEEMRELEEAEKRVLGEIENEKKDRYQVKLGIWELKNQIMDLNSICQEEEEEYQRLSHLVGYQEEQYEEGEKGEGEEGEMGEEGTAEMGGYEQPEEGGEGEGGEGGAGEAASQQERRQVVSEQQERECSSML